uniref:Abi family protein n=2 Tax=Fusobacterium TaxID=848 RepID=UPI003FEDC948
FNKIYELYKFDRKLASYIFEMVEKIEVAFKTKLIYNILERTKELGPFGYLETSEWKDYSFKDEETGNSRMKKFRDILKDKMDFKKRVLEFTMRDIKPYIEHYFEKYKKESFVPLWILSEVIDFGMTMKMYEESVRDIQTKVAEELGNFKNKDLAFYLKSIKLIRNTVAHNGILWNFRFINRINKPLVNNYKFVDDKSFVAVLIVIVEILKYIDKDFDHTELKNMIKKFFKDNTTLVKKFGIKNGNIDIIDKILI